MRVFLRNFVLVCIGAALAALAVEGILRITDTDDYNKLAVDPTSGLWIYRPGIPFTHASSCYENLVRINNLGFHGADIAQQKPPGVFRIVVVGNSFTEAASVPVAGMYTTLLEQKLNAMADRTHTYEVIPLGFSGTGTYLNYLYYLRFGRALSPDLVINMKTGNELERDRSYIDFPPRFDEKGHIISTVTRSSKIPSTLKDIARMLKLVINVSNRRYFFSANIQAFLSRPVFFGVGLATTTQDTALSPAEVETLWPVEERVFNSFTSTVRGDGSRFLLAGWNESSTPVAEVADTVSHLTKMSKQAGVGYADLAPSIAEQARVSGVNASWRCDEHWSDAGNGYAAEALYQYLIAHPSLIR